MSADGQAGRFPVRWIPAAWALFAAAGDIDVGTSLGMAVYPDDADTLDRLLTASDAAMYAAAADDQLGEGRVLRSGAIMSSPSSARSNCSSHSWSRSPMLRTFVFSR